MFESGQRQSHRPSRWGGPAMSVKVEIGVSLSNNDPPHTRSWSYESKSIQRRGQNQQQGYALDSRQHIPGRDQDYYHHSRERGLDVRPRESERGHSVPPPERIDQFHIYDPVSPVSPTIHTPTSSTAGYRERPLPPVPSSFRLGDENLPWSSTTPAWIPEEPEPAYVDIPVFIESERRTFRHEDPQRVRELESLHNALMTVDSLDAEQWTPRASENAGSPSRDPPARDPAPRDPGPRSVGWAVSSHPRGTYAKPPPPYCVSQYQAAVSRSIGRRRSST